MGLLPRKHHRWRYSVIGKLTGEFRVPIRNSRTTHLSLITVIFHFHFRPRDLGNGIGDRTKLRRSMTPPYLYGNNVDKVMGRPGYLVMG